MEMKKKSKKGVLLKSKKTFQNHILLQKSHQKNKYLNSPLCKILWDLNEMDKWETQTIEPKD